MKSQSKFLWLVAALIMGGAAWWFMTSDAPLAIFRFNKLSSETTKILEGADEFVLYSLNPVPIELLKPADERPQEVFHSFPVLGKTKIVDQAEKKAILQTLYSGIAESDGSAAKCFFPRHGIRATLGGETVELVICFECLHIEAFLENRYGVQTTASPQPVFDRALEKAGVPLAKKIIE